MLRLCVLELGVEMLDESVDARDEELERTELKVVGVLDVNEAAEELLVVGMPELVEVSCAALDVLRDDELKIEELELSVEMEELDVPALLEVELSVEDENGPPDALVALVEVKNVELDGTVAVEDGDEGAT